MQTQKGILVWGYPGLTVEFKNTYYIYKNSTEFKEFLRKWRRVCEFGYRDRARRIGIWTCRIPIRKEEKKEFVEDIKKLVSKGLVEDKEYVLKNIKLEEMEKILEADD